MKSKKSLEELTTQANDLHRQADEAENSAIQFAKQAGEVLLKIKSRLNQHGSWLHWLENNFDASSETANHYMRIAKNWPALEKYIADNPKLSKIAALRILRKPKETPETSVDTPDQMDMSEWEREYGQSLAVQHKRAKLMLRRAFMHAVDGFSEDLAIYLACLHTEFDAFKDDFRERYIDPIRTNYEPLALPALEALDKRDTPPWLTAPLKKHASGNPDLTIEDAQEMTFEELLHPKKDAEPLRPPSKENMADERYTLRQTFAIHLKEMTNQEVEFLVGKTEEPGTNRLSAILDELRSQILTQPRTRRIA